MGLFDFRGIIGEGEQQRSRRLQNEENALRLRAMQREEENLLRQQQAMPALMNRLNTSGAMLPEGERTIENSIFSDRNTSTNELLGRVDPEAAMKQSMAVAYPGPRKIMMGKPGEVPLDENGLPVGPAVPGGGPVFKPTNMQIPGTNRIVVARTPEEFNAYVDEGFVEQGSGVPGAKEEQRPYRVMTKEEVRAASLPEGGSYKTNGLDVQAIVQPNRDQGPGALKLANAEVEAESLGFALDEFERIVRATPEGARTGALFGGLTKEGQDLNSAWTNAALIAKGEALFNLGVLSGPDLTIIQKALPDPSTKSGVFKDKDTYYKGIEQIRNLMNRRLSAARRAYAPPSQQSGRGEAAPLGDDVESLLNKYAPRN